MTTVPNHEEQPASLSRIDRLAEHNLKALHRAREFIATRTLGNEPTAIETPDDFGASILAPKVTPEMFHGLTGEVMRTATTGTEVHPAAAGAAFLTFASAALGRERYVRIGNGMHHPRLYMVHAGRSGSAGKGMALELTNRIREAAEQDDPSALPCGNVHHGGLSTSEGLVWAIRDESDEKDSDGIPTHAGIADKRLHIIEEELANALEQGNRSGNTLSMTLRMAWDGIDLAPLTKTSRTRATKPHICIYGCITPSELSSAMRVRDLTNGFANRFLFIWAERQGVVPFPAAAGDTAILDFATRLKDSIAIASSSEEVSASPEARSLFEDFYYGHRQGVGVPSVVQNLTERHPPYAWRLALTFALLDQSDVIDAPHMKAALAWLTFCRESVVRIFSSVDLEEQAIRAGEFARRILAALQVAQGNTLSRVHLRKALGKPSNNVLDAALDQLDMAGFIHIIATPRQGGGRPLREYSLRR